MVAVACYLDNSYLLQVLHFLTLPSQTIFFSFLIAFKSHKREHDHYKLRYSRDFELFLSEEKGMASCARH